MSVPRDASSPWIHIFKRLMGTTRRSSSMRGCQWPPGRSRQRHADRLRKTQGLGRRRPRPCRWVIRWAPADARDATTLQIIIRGARPALI